MANKQSGKSTKPMNRPAIVELVEANLVASEAGRLAANIMDRAYGRRGETDAVDVVEGFCREASTEIVARLAESLGISQTKSIARDDSVRDDSFVIDSLNRLLERPSIDATTADAVRDILAEVNARKGNARKS